MPVYSIVNNGKITNFTATWFILFEKPCTFEYSGQAVGIEFPENSPYLWGLRIFSSKLSRLNLMLPGH
jgi:hypothetical protein